MKEKQQPSLGIGAFLLFPVAVVAAHWIKDQRSSFDAVKLLLRNTRYSLSLSFVS